MLNRMNFLGIPDEYASYDRSRFVVLPIPWERTTSYKPGTRFGPSALIQASSQVERFDEELGFEPWKAGIHTLPPTPLLSDVAAFLKSVGDLVEPHVAAGKFLFAIGGEHAITEGPLSGVCRVIPKISVLHVDAHADLRESFEGSPYNHACAARRMTIYAEKIVQVGIRCVSEDEYPFTNSGKVRTFLAQKNRDVTALASKVLEELGPNVYISIDLDGLDPSVVPGVGTPVPGGLGWWETLHLLREVISAKNVVAADVVELCPVPDYVISEFTAARLVYRMMGYVVHKEAQKDTVRRPRPKTRVRK